MTAKIEVFANINCPFTHVVLKVIEAEVDSLDIPVSLRVRAWPPDVGDLPQVALQVAWHGWKEISTTTSPCDLRS